MSHYLLALLLLPSIGAAYMAWFTGSHGSQGVWPFSAFAVFFALLAFAAARRRPPPASPARESEIRFTSHRTWILAIVLFGLLILAAAWGLWRS